MKTLVSLVSIVLFMCLFAVSKLYAQGYSVKNGDSEPIRGLTLKELQAIIGQIQPSTSSEENPTAHPDDMPLPPTLYQEQHYVSPNPFVKCLTSGIPGCSDANLNFEQANFNGWRARTGIFKLPAACTSLQTNCATTTCTPVDEWNTNASILNSTSNDFKILSKTGNASITDYYGGFPIFTNATGNHVARIGNDSRNWDAHQIAYTYKTTRDNPFILYRYAPVLELPVKCNAGDEDHSYCDNPKFQVRVYDENCNLVVCGSLDVSPGAPEMKYFYTKSTTNRNNTNTGYCDIAVGYKDWTTNVVDLRQYFSSTEERSFTIVFSVSDCAWGGHFGYAYIDANCTNTVVDVAGNPCVANELTFSSPGLNHASELITWNFGDGTQNQTGNIITHKFATAGTYNVKCTLTYNNGYVPQNQPCQLIFENETVIDACDGYALKCEECIKSFQPDPGKKYIISAWVKEARDDLPVNSGFYTYSDPQIVISFSGSGAGSPQTFSAEGPIIDGWQRIHSVFTVPSNNITDIYLDLKNNGTHDVFFDDVRVFPVDGTMKSYVYDPLTQRLMAELDENNYATLYEYNKEGTLVRVKKETERGIKTIKENQSSTKVK